MDWSRFHLDRQPFRPAVDPDSYFPAPSHEAALTAVASAFARRDPVVLLDGSGGVGKTLVARKWLEHLLPDVPRVILPSARATVPAELLQAILFDLGKPYHGFSEQELRLAVTECLLTAAESGYPTVLVLDEAQHMSQPAFEELRLLGNLETRRGAAVFTLLVAHPMLREALRRPAYELFAQRVGVRCAVEPLTPDESADYLRHQVRAAGGEAGPVFEDEAVSLLSGACGGIPRVLNQVAGLAMELAAGAGNETVDAEAALEALARFEREPAASEEPGGPAEPVLLPHPGRMGDAGGDEAATGRGSKDRASRKRTA